MKAEFLGMTAFAAAAMTTIEREQHAQFYDRLSDIARRRTTTVCKLLISLWRATVDTFRTFLTGTGLDSQQLELAQHLLNHRLH